MNSTQQTALFPFMQAQASAGRQVSSTARSRPPRAWSFRADLPLVREPIQNAAGLPVTVRTPADIAALCDDLRLSAQEAFVVIDLNTRNNVIDKRLVTLGLLDASLVHPREVFRGAVSSGAAAVVVLHNHPSGDPTPSAEDIRITRQLVEAGRVLDIRVLDHVIIGRPALSPVEGSNAANGTPACPEPACGEPVEPVERGFLSLRESGLVSFES